MNAKATSTTLEDTNKIHVSQGDGTGIGLEVFFKSIILLDQRILKHLVLHANATLCERTLDLMGVHYKFTNNRITISSSEIEFIACQEDAFNCFDSAISATKPGDILFTLPASKKSFPKGSPGHTAYLRTKAGHDVAMFFHAPQARVLLLSDHISLNEVRSSLTFEKIYSITSKAIEGSKRFLNETPKNIIFAGVNPHAGENGILGDDQSLFEPAIKKLLQQYSMISFKGPVSGDTLFNHTSVDTWVVFAHHDQGLSPFKSKFGVTGANISLGLNFLRLSVDHGTAEDKFGLNCSNYMGCIYCLQQAFNSLGRV